MLSSQARLMFMAFFLFELASLGSCVFPTAVIFSTKPNSFSGSIMSDQKLLRLQTCAEPSTMPNTIVGHAVTTTGNGIWWIVLLWQNGWKTCWLGHY